MDKELMLILILIANAILIVVVFVLVKLSLVRNNRRWNKIITAQDHIGAAPLNLENTLNIIVHQLMEATGATGAAIELIEGDEIYYRAAAGTLLGFIGYRIKFLNSLSGHCIAYREIVNCADTEKDSRVNHEATRKFKIRSMVVAPLLSEVKRSEF